MIIDTNRRTTARLGCLREQGVQTLIRYYARSTSQPEKRLTRAEAEAVIASGASLAVVHQAGGADASSFSSERGRLDAEYALKYAIESIGQPAGSALYFAVDFDCNAAQFQQRVVPHFEAIREVNLGGQFAKQFAIGAYGNGLVLRRLLAQGLCDFAWLSQSLGHAESREFKASNDWTLFQHLPSSLCGIGVDVDELNPAAAGGFGAFGDLDPPQAAPADGGPTPQASMRFRTMAASGLRLRAGPGTEFEVRRLLPLGTLVEVISRFGDWAIVDVSGDGSADGAVHSAFLAIVA